MVTLVVLISVIMAISQAFAISDFGSPTTTNYNASTGCPRSSCTIQTCEDTTCIGNASSDCVQGTVCGPVTYGTCKAVGNVWTCI
jgi:hypothetical protein